MLKNIDRQFSARQLPETEVAGPPETREICWVFLKMENINSLDPGHSSNNKHCYLV
jgi:hypothetical protein